MSRYLRMLPEMVASILSDSSRRQRVLSQCDASDVLRDAFLQIEASMNHYYEGCTATVFLVWADGENFYVQCANVGDSACVMKLIGGAIPKPGLSGAKPVSTLFPLTGV
ncbi:Protein phosphatase 2C 70 [Camellia lanceoleosa]|uniref:Protein phosphatase 2C 70 n=1 Tax=Camellia lanceoleosa TaxID=1840588 RepID=A0ACC0H934_9ERIC|nr:Protein phosphatase 2C 70 [Camellia lanceoleosa]